MWAESQDVGRLSRADGTGSGIAREYVETVNLNKVKK
jgi:hypothetical protein